MSIRRSRFGGKANNGRFNDVHGSVNMKSGSEWVGVALGGRNHVHGQRGRHGHVVLGLVAQVHSHAKFFTVELPVLVNV